MGAGLKGKYGSGGRSGGAGFNGGLLRQAGETERGLFLSTPGADLSWHLRAEERTIADAGTPAKLLFANRDKDANLEISLPLDWLASPETVNTRSLQYTRYPNPVAEAKAYADFHGLRVSSKREGTAGDDETLTVNYGLPDKAAVQSFARIPFKRGLTPDQGEFLQITSPGGGEAATGDSRFQTNRIIRYTYFQAGENGNGFAVRYRIGKASSGGGSVTAEYDSETQLTITLLFPSTSTGLAYSVNISQIVAAVNAARWSGTRLVEASLASADGLVGFVASRNPSVGDSLTPTNPSAARTGLSLSGGVGFTGLGSNIGEVRVSKTGARTAGAKAKATLDVNPGNAANNIVITAKADGAALNNTPIGCRFQSVAVPSNSVAIIGQSGRLQLAINGTVTLQAVVDKINGAAANTFASQFTAALGTGESGSTQVTWGSGDSATSAAASGGSDAVNPLEAIWDDDNHRLVIRAIETDTLTDVRAAITALDEFDSASITLVNALTTDTIDLPAAIGQFQDYSFGGGSDARHRSSISFSESSSALIVNGVLAEDTVQQVIDRGQGVLEFFTLSVKPGSNAADAFPAFETTTAALANGVDAVARQLPAVTLRDNGVVAISLHSATGAAWSTTLGELEAAFRAARYKRRIGAATAVFPRDNAEIKSPGLASDPLNNVELPSQAAGGANPVPTGVIEAIPRPNDEVNGPNILIRYHADHDTLQAIAAAIMEGGSRVNVQVLYDTDLTSDAEEPPFARGFYFGESGDGSVSGLSAEQVRDTVAAFVREGTNITIRHDDAANTLTISSTADGTGGLTAEQVRDTVAAFLRAAPGSGLTVAHDDAANTLTIRFTLPNQSVTPAKLDAGDATKKAAFRAAFGLGSAATKDVGEASGVAGLNAQGTLYSNEIPSYLTRDTELAAAIAAIKGGAPADYDTLKELADAIGLRLADRGSYLPTAAYKIRDVVRHNGGGSMAAYIALTDISAGTAAASEPAVGSAWKTYWYRIGYEDGDPNAFTGGSVNNGVLSLTRESGANPLALMLGSVGDQTTRVEQVAIQNVASATTDVELQPAASNPISVIVGEGSPQLITGVAGNDATLSAGVYIVDVVAEVRAADTNAARNAVVNVALRDASDNSIFAGGVSTSPKVSPQWSMVSFVAIVALNETKAVNLFLNRAGAATQLRNIKAEFFRFGGSSPEVGVSFTTLIDDNFQALTNQRWSAVDFKAGAADWDQFQFLYIEYAVRANALLSGFFSRNALERLTARVANNVNNWYTGGNVNKPPATFLVDQGGHGLAVGKTTDKGQLLFAHSQNTATASAKLFVMGINFGRPNVEPSLMPHISSFSATRGNLSPAAGAIGTVRYGVEWRIAQSSHVAAARIVGFKGVAANPSSVAVLKTIAAAEYAHGTSDVAIPSGVTLAANETYTLRLEAYSAGQTPATDTPRSYQDIRITAHAAASAAYHVGVVRYMSSDADGAATAARITDLTGDTATSPSLPSRLTIAVPAAPSGAEWQLYLLAKASEPQPAGFTSAGLPANNAFYDAEDVTIATVAYKAYILKPSQRLTTADNGDYFGVTPP